MVVYDDKSKYDYIISNDYNEEVNIAMPKYKIKYYDYSQRGIFINEYYSNKFIRSGLKYLMMDLKENLVILNGDKVE